MCLLVFHRSLWCLYVLFQPGQWEPVLSDCGHWVHFNFHFKFVFSFYNRVWNGFWFFSFSLDLEVDLHLLFVACVSFFGRICCFIFFWVVFSIYFFYEVSFGDLWCLFWCGWLFQQDLLYPLGWILWIMALVHLVLFVYFGFFLFFA